MADCTELADYLRSRRPEEYTNSFGGQSSRGRRGGFGIGAKQRWKEDEGSSDNKERHPRGLKGREIGLWYSRRAQERKADPDYKPKNKKELPSIPIDIPPAQQREIRDLLDKISVSIPPCVRKAQGETLPEDKYSHVEESDFKRRFLKSITGSLLDNINEAKYKGRLSSEPGETDIRYRDQLLRKEKDPDYLEMLKFRKTLPAYEKMEEVLELVNKNQVVLISGETGCGKTTQVPQFILDQEILAGRGSSTRIVCTQPRRISAISVAERVASERAERLGDSVGFHIRLERQLPRSTGAIIFCTTGMCLQYMEGDPTLSEISHIILDEIHERDTVSDFLLCILKDIITVRPDLKVILMSATLNADKFSKYFNDCPSLNIPGFTFPVKEYYLEDVVEVLRFKFNSRRQGGGGAGWRQFSKKKESKERTEILEPFIRNLKRNGKYSEETVHQLLLPESEDINLDLMYELILHICTREPMGAILVFLPGWDKISNLNKLLTDSGRFPSSKYSIIPLHSMMPTVQQKSIFRRPPPGIRKIVIATNIAETSITIDDIVYVIDCGKIKMKNYDIENNLGTLQEEWVSLANAKQRRGRAGRVQEGVCYHLFSRGREMLLDSYQLPEMLRTRLEEVILQAKILQVGLVGPFLDKVLDSPDPRAVQISLHLLKSMNALDDDEHLTPLGYHLAHLPMDPQAGKMILLAAMFGCLDPITSIAASLSFKDAWVTPLGKEKEVDRCKEELARGCKSDHLLMAEVMRSWEKAEEERRGWEFTRYYFLSRNTLELLRDMKQQFTKYLWEMKFLTSNRVKDRHSNFNSDNIGLVKAIVCAGLYPNVAVLLKVKTKKKTGSTILSLVTPEGEKVKLHPKSLNDKTKEFESRLLVYHLKLKSSAIYLHDTSLAFPLALIFFCDRYSVQEEGDKRVIVVSNIIKFSLSRSTFCLIQELRAWLDWLLEYKVAHPGVTDWNTRSDESYILWAIIKLISIEHQMYSPDDDYSSAEDDY